METRKSILLLNIILLLVSINLVYSADPTSITNQNIQEQATQNACLGDLSICLETNRNYSNEIQNLIDERDYYRSLYLNSTYNITNQELINIYNLYNQTINNYNQSIQEINQNIKHIEYKFYFVFVLFIIIELGLFGINWKMNNNFKADVRWNIHKEVTSNEFKTQIINIIKEHKDEKKGKEKHR